MIITEKTYHFKGSLQRFISELSREHDRLVAAYGTEHFTLDFGSPSSDSLDTYTRARRLIYWRKQTPAEGHKVEMVVFYNLPSLDGENIKLRADILDEPGLLNGWAAFSYWQETEKLWLKSGLMEEQAHEKNSTPKKRRTKRGAQERTMEVLQKLREIRLTAIRSGRQIPKKEIAMKDAGGITPYTWKRYDPELWKNWNDRK